MPPEIKLLLRLANKYLPPLSHKHRRLIELSDGGHSNHSGLVRFRQRLIPNASAQLTPLKTRSPTRDKAHQRQTRRKRESCRKNFAILRLQSSTVKKTDRLILFLQSFLTCLFSRIASGPFAPFVEGGDLFSGGQNRSGVVVHGSVHHTAL